MKRITKKYLYAFYFVILFLLPQCSSVEEQGGVAFTFDDQYIAEWVEYADLFDKYNIEATFYISRPQLLDSKQIEGLKYLSAKGHEIGCHGYNHKNALDYSDSVESYYKLELKPAINILDSLGFECSSFAYPFGNSTVKMDSLLLTYFDNIRKATWNSNGTTLDFYDKIYATKDNYRLINSMGLDNNYKIDLQSIASGIDRALERDEVLVFHNHKINSSHSDYTVTPEYLESVFKLCKEKGIRTFRINELSSLFKTRN